MKNSPILNERPFDLSDGDRYFIVINGNHVFTRKFNGDPVITGNFKEAKIYKDLNLIQRVALELFSTNKHYQTSEIGIARVKDNFEPRYVVKYEKQHWSTQSPKLTCHVEWFKIGEYVEGTYLDYDEAKGQLEKFKHDMIEHHYGEIMKTRKLELKKI